MDLDSSTAVALIGTDHIPQRHIPLGLPVSLFVPFVF